MSLCPVLFSDGSTVAAGFVTDCGARHAVLHAAEAAAEALGKLMASAPQTGLQGVFGYAKFLGGFSGGIAFDFAQNESGPQQGRKFVEIFVDDLANFRSGVDLLGRRAIVGEALGGRQFILVMCFVKGNRWARLGAAALHERGVDDDAREPGGKLGAALEALQIAIGGKQSVLQGVFGVFRVAEHTKGGLKQLAMVTAKQRFNCLSVATLTCTNQLLFRKLRCIDHLRCHFFPQVASYESLRAKRLHNYTSGPAHSPRPSLGASKERR